MNRHDDAIRSVDLDAFLTSVESKLRGPFSSLDLAKAIQTSQNREYHLAPAAYLQCLYQVLGRTDKATQLRSILALLGLDPSLEADEEIQGLLQYTQEKADPHDPAPPTTSFEEWVRVMSGLVQGILFETAEGLPQRGPEARTMLDKTCREILKQVKLVLEATEPYDNDDDEEDDNQKESGLATAETDPTFLPYRYALLDPDRLDVALPGAFEHHHFGVQDPSDETDNNHDNNETTPGILQLDDQQERQRALEDKEHDTSSALAKKGPAATGTTVASKTAPASSFPGFRSSSSNKTAAKPRPKPSMFLTRKPAQAAAAARTVLKTRKVGAAQSLVASRRRAAAGATAGKLGGTAGPRLGRAQAKMAQAAGGAGKSRMMFLDEKESNGIIAKEESAAAAPAAGEPKKKVSLKRKADAGAATPTAKLARKPAPQVAEPAAAPPATEIPTAADALPTKTKASSLASAALSAYQAQIAVPVAPVAAPVAPAAVAHKQQDWRELLKERSNKLSEEDRFRIKQFFVDRTNPTPQESVVRLKLHEERTADPATGDPVKETFYLELDYKDFTSRQSRKIKRY